MATNQPEYVLKLITWNVGHRDEPWRTLIDSDADVALLQEAAAPPRDIAERLEVDVAPWLTAGTSRRSWRTAIVKLSDRVNVEWLTPHPVEESPDGGVRVSHGGTLAVAIVSPRTGSPITVASMYAPWEGPHASTGSKWIYADASAHRVISDLSPFIGHERNHRIIAAGDLNLLHGYGEHGKTYWAARYATVFDRMRALGLPFVGPQAPMGTSADPWPAELPAGSKNVPTFHTNRQTPATATRQLDFVFASASMAQQVQVKARNSLDDWGPSDHCRVEIEVAWD